MLEYLPLHSHPSLTLLLKTQFYHRYYTVWRSKAEITRVHVSIAKGVDMEA